MKYIYALSKDDKIIYVGLTKQKKKRLTTHSYRFGKDIEMITLEKCANSDSLQREAYWIQYYKDLGCTLENKNDGGNGVQITTE